MKEVKAYIKPHKRGAVVHALHRIEGLTGASVVEARGFGRSGGRSDRHGIEDELELLAAHLQVTVMCRDAEVEEVVGAIVENAHTGLHGDGKVYVLDVADAVRIATGERGDEAV